MGAAWSVLNPILMLTIYTFVFSVVLKARWGTNSDSKTEFALALFIGLIVHAIFAECLNRAPSLITSNVNYVKKVVFPIEILPWTVMGTALFHALASIAVWLVFYMVVKGIPNLTILYLPLIMLPLILFTMGCSWFLASLGVYLRDIGQLVAVITTIALFMSPVFYPVSMLPEKFQIFIYLNPLTYIIEESRNVLLWGEAPNFWGLALSTSASFVIAWLGFRWFQKTKKGFADVL